MKELINLQLMMFALIITGLILKKVGVVGKEVQKGMTNLVIDLILPCNIIYSFMIKFSSKIAQDFVVILVISILIQVFCVILGGVLYNKCSRIKEKNVCVMQRFVLMRDFKGIQSHRVFLE